jgi:nitroreductase
MLYRDKAAEDLSNAPLPEDDVGLLQGITSTRAIRRYTDEPVAPDALRAMLFAATRAPSGSNRQPFRFLVLTDGPHAAEAKRLLGERARAMWAGKRVRDGFDKGSGSDPSSPKARLDRTLQEYAENFHRIPVVVFPFFVPYREPATIDGANIYPACQNLLLAARALGYGGVMTGLHRLVEPQLREMLSVPENAVLAATITIGRPAGSQGPVRRRPLRELVFTESWGDAPHWAQDPPGTRFTAAGPPSEG